METIIDRVWGDAVPEHARNAVYVYVARLRRILGEAGAREETSALLVRRSRGYLLDVDPSSIDIHRFRRLLDRAQDPSHDDIERAAMLRQALDLWRGDPLAGLPGEWVAQVREGWRQSRLDVTVSWAEAELRRDNAARVIGPLLDMVGEHPLVESLVALLMRALQATGRRAQALDCFASTRMRLVEQLGVEPGAELQGLHRAILRGELDHSQPSAVVAQQAVGVPALLPLDVRGFVCRDRELAQLDTVLTSADGQSAATVIAVVSGTAGVGKTNS